VRMHRLPHMTHICSCATVLPHHVVESTDMQQPERALYQ
jgi:hypothetical protein